MERHLTGRHALVTGAGRGIGAAIARRLAAEGARLTLLGRTRAPLDALAEEIGASVLQADVTDDAAFARVFAAAGPVDVLVNNAGAAATAPFVRTDRALWDSMLAVNLTSVFTGCKLALPGMVERGWGRIVTVASTAGLRGYAYCAAYAAAKHGVIGLTRTLALETARAGVTVNAVCPGFADTGMTAESLDRIQAKTGRTRDEAVAELTKSNPQGRLVRPEEVADAVAWLCGPAAASITGQAIAVAGGEVM
ncbi:SDR family NAD(P)-dependent oxidoreductase [Azospirillum sp. TSO22-1]|uniref:SDR family NAD(P)-dependent oxidoreductase n=1 Tax=Azospirillum sp. TSO22-1 TaxID=716789 RepID=UPI000D61FE77|nr:SDR family NAD(P)-dependent oxidoreductase [Azospirillum sp. TSO22-1]PWC41707.1 3-hydroxyacyl-CoA dehydrogenase [Azospirillum sp. TSO22-1]